MNVVKVETGDLTNAMRALGRAARTAATQLAMTDGATKDKALRAMAAELRRRGADILAANAADMSEAKGLSAALLDRLMLDAKRVEAMAKGLEEIAEQRDPISRVLSEWD